MGLEGEAAAWGDGTLHPAIAAFIARARQAGTPAFHTCSPDQARAIIAAGRVVLGDGPALHDSRMVAIPGRGGSIPALLCVPDGEPVGLCVLLHGGGWVFSTPADYETLARTLAQRSGCTVLVPDYRLAPEHPFPAGLEDCEDALLWADRERATLAHGGAKLVIAGDSAGGNLATVCAARLSDRIELAGQVLIYPVTDADLERPSYHRFGTGLPLQREDMAWFFDHYAPAERRRDPAIAPLHHPSPADLPQTVMLLAELDVLRDEGEAYARLLAAHGKLVAIHRYHHVTHGFIRLHNLVDVADRAVTDVADAVRRFAD